MRPLVRENRAFTFDAEFSPFLERDSLVEFNQFRDVRFFLPLPVSGDLEFAHGFVGSEILGGKKAQENDLGRSAAKRAIATQP